MGLVSRELTRTGSGMAAVPDLVRDSKLETRHTNGHTIHRYLEASSNRRRVPREEYWKRERDLGHGSFGRVWLEKCVKGNSKGELRAVKMVRNFSKSSSAVDFNRELEAVAKFSNAKYEACFVKSFGWYDDPEAIFIALEYCPHGDLHRFLSRTSSLPVGEAQELTRQILEGLHDMHENGFAHRDLKPANILIKNQPPETWWVKLADFGISKRAEDGTGPSTIKGTLEFMAPEMLGFVRSGSDSKPYAPQMADMWALGEIAFRMLTGEHTFRDLRSLGDYCRNMDEFPSERLKSLAGDDAAQFIAALMATDPHLRMNTKDALGHPWPLTQPLQLEDVGPQEELQTVVIPEASARWSTVSTTPIFETALHFKAQQPSPRTPAQDAELTVPPEPAAIEEQSDYESSTEEASDWGPDYGKADAPPRSSLDLYKSSVPPLHQDSGFDESLEHAIAAENTTSATEESEGASQRKSQMLNNNPVPIPKGISKHAEGVSQPTEVPQLKGKSQLNLHLSGETKNFMVPISERAG
ncbi:MAG: hypothetical protein M1822_009111 [Bathelium mastoideum]|nr:MAG: hypothetical protein M1822_009111 [Bathelium mastoideum]